MCVAMSGDRSLCRLLDLPGWSGRESELLDDPDDLEDDLEEEPDCELEEEEDPLVEEVLLLWVLALLPLWCLL